MFIIYNPKTGEDVTECHSLENLIGYIILEGGTFALLKKYEVYYVDNNDERHLVRTR